jgi:hypothetical protein
MLERVSPARNTQIEPALIPAVNRIRDRVAFSPEALAAQARVVAEPGGKPRPTANARQGVPKTRTTGGHERRAAPANEIAPGIHRANPGPSRPEGTHHGRSGHSIAATTGLNAYRQTVRETEASPPQSPVIDFRV